MNHREALNATEYGTEIPAGLRSPVFRPFPMKDIRPEGWLRNQLKIQANGLSGHLDLFWTDICDSQWIGGTAEGWERVPYWLDGFIPLAWLLENEALQARATRYVDYILSHQQEDGWICPAAPENRSQYDMWALFLILKVLVVYHDATGDERVEGAIYKALKALDRHIDSNTLFAWAQTRWFECLISLFWLYERTGEAWLLHLASKLKAQGFDWQSLFQAWPYEEPDEMGRWSQMSHVVNNAMMLKSGALIWRMNGDASALDSAKGMLDQLDASHGMVTGIFTGDECLGGKSPVRGTELCAVVEALYSLEHLSAISGNPAYGDRMDKIAWNALPATFSPDMWTHQYDQQVNQVQCTVQEKPVFGTNSGESNTFGLEPNFGCCTANLSQAWPKLALSTMMRISNPDDSTTGIAVILYAPSSVSTTIQGIAVSLSMETDYPFRDTVRFTVEVKGACRFPIQFRIPAWAENPVIRMAESTIPAKAGTYHALDRDWSGVTTFELVLPMLPTLEDRPNGMKALVRGPLVYSLAIGENWRRIHEEVPGREAPHCDFEIHATSEWNFGLDGSLLHAEGDFGLDGCLLKKEGDSGTTGLAGLRFEEKPVGAVPFSPEGAPLEVMVPVRKIDWSLQNGSASPVPGLAWTSEAEETKRFIPYGCTNLRLTEMPLLQG